MNPVVRALAIFAVLTSFAPVAAAVPAPPVPPVRPITETIFGTTVTDPYRWMENMKTPEFQAFLHAQNDYTQRVLSQLPQRSQVYARVHALTGAADAAVSGQIDGNLYFYLFRPAGANNPRLYVRPASGGAPRSLINPDAMSSPGKQLALSFFVPSWDGHYVTYGISENGSEDATLYVMDVRTGKRLSEVIDRAQFGAQSWRADNRSFYYFRLQKPVPGAAPTDKYKNVTTYLHMVGTSAANDVAVTGNGVNPRIKTTPDDDVYVLTTPDSAYAIAAVAHGVKNELDLYAAPAALVNNSSTPWVKVADANDDVTSSDLRGNTIYLLTHKNASRFKIVATDLRHPDFAHARTVVPPSNVVISGFGVSADALYVHDLDAGIGRIRRMPFNDPAAIARVALPYEGAIDNFSTDAREPGVLFSINAWTRSRQWFRDLGPSGTIVPTHMVKPSPVDFSQYTSAEVRAPGLDGTPVPLSIIYRKGLKLDGSHPTWLDGYGAYAITIDPYFDPSRLAFLEHGGVMAYAHVRGGGEYGEDWHRAGMKASKHHTWEDFIACGRYLVAHGYTSPAHLGGMGTSAGGITIGRAITTAPQLFAAAIIDVGSSDPLRQEFSPNGPPNIPEFGTQKDPADFKALLDMDAYLHVKDGVAYPAVLVQAGANDPRVDAWEGGKMAARLAQATTSGKPVLLRVDFSAGHGFGSSRVQRDQLTADETTFFLWQLRAPGFTSVPTTVGPYPRASIEPAATPAPSATASGAPPVPPAPTPSAT